jgi:hypothetical protein
MKHLSVFFALFLPLACFSAQDAGNGIMLKSGNFRIVVNPAEPRSVQIAVSNFRLDLQKTLGSNARIDDRASDNAKQVQLIIVNDETKQPGISAPKSPDGFESHRIYADPAKNRIYIHGTDARGTIYAVYSFSEQLLKIPPLWFFSSLKPERKASVTVPADYDYFVKSPQVRYRAWFPNDQDLLVPWEKEMPENRSRWMEAMMRLKLNSIEMEGSVDMSYRMNRKSRDVTDYGFVLSSHHFVALNNTYRHWDDYWTKMKGMEKAPEILLANEDKLEEYWRYSAETVRRNKIDNLWTISFRGNGDRPFWATFKDAPDNDRDRGSVITRMLQKQLDIIREITKEEDPYLRITFYDEMSDLLALGYVQPPAGKNIIRTYVAARRDHYPNEDIVHFNPSQGIKLGYYMNLQFTSTGAHLAPAEGPWKMEFNYRYINSRAPLFFSVVNAGNIREFLFTMSANAAMMWDFSAYTTDAFVLDFCRQYYGEKHAGEIARLYRDYFYSFWQQKKTEFPGMERQFIFQDLRYARLIRLLGKDFFHYNPNPLEDVGFERTPGRTYRVVPADNQADNQIDAILNGMLPTISRFEKTAEACSEIIARLDRDRQIFFNDDLRTKACFMAGISKMAWHTVYAYRHQQDMAVVLENINAAIVHLKAARSCLFESQHGAFSNWYDGDKGGKFGIESLLKTLEKIKKQAEEMAV